MDFFEHQDRARSASKTLVFLFLVAVCLIVVAVLCMTGLVIRINFNANPFNFSQFGQTYIVTGLVTAGVIFLGSFYKVFLLSSFGGISVALDAGGRAIDPSTKNFKERRLLNIVEEMSIASGVAMPEVFILPDSGINAFAAGNSQKDAAVAVTESCLDLLTRDELQGVIAHEFSHIFHGDMKLNMRITGVIFGILILSFLGRLCMRFGVGAGVSRHRSSKKGGGVFWLAIVGIGLFVIGSLGVFFGRLIQSAVSRQREFLADASAVQYTRNPQGISGALQKIGAWVHGSNIENEHKDELSHFYISSPFRARKFSDSLMATHPPLSKRIKAIDKTWDGRFEKIDDKSEVKDEVEKDTRAEKAEVSGLSKSQVLHQLGELNNQQVLLAHVLLYQLPDFIKTNAHEAYSARAVVYAVFLDKDQITRGKQLLKIREHRQDDLIASIEKMEQEIQKFGKSARLAMIDISLPSLRRLSPKQTRQFLETLKDLIMTDQKVELYEFALYSLLVYHLDPKEWPSEALNKTNTAESFACLVSGMAHAGYPSQKEAQQAYERAFQKTGMKAPPFLDLSSCGPAPLTKSMRLLRQAPPQVKKLVVTTLIECASDDSRVEVEELELLRAIGECLEVPIPLATSKG